MSRRKKMRRWKMREHGALFEFCAAAYWAVAPGIWAERYICFTMRITD